MPSRAAAGHFGTFSTLAFTGRIPATGALSNATIAAGHQRPGTNPQSAAAAPTRAEPQLAVHLPRPRRRALVLQRGIGDVSRPDRRKRSNRDDLCVSSASVHAIPDCCDTDCASTSGTAPSSSDGKGRGSIGLGTAQRMQLSPALSFGTTSLYHRSSVASCTRAGSSSSVSLPRGNEWPIDLIGPFRLPNSTGWADPLVQFPLFARSKSGRSRFRPTGGGAGAGLWKPID